MDKMSSCVTGIEFQTSAVLWCFCCRKIVESKTQKVDFKDYVL